MLILKSVYFLVMIQNFILVIFSFLFKKKKTGWGVSHVLPCLKNNKRLLLKTFSETIYDYCIKLPHKMSGVSCAHGAAVYSILHTNIIMFFSFMFFSGILKEVSQYPM